MRRLTDWQAITADGRPTAKVRCPGCGLWATLDHDIAPDGTVTPSLDCPADYCDFHDNVVLAGWARQRIGLVPDG